MLTKTELVTQLSNEIKKNPFLEKTCSFLSSRYETFIVGGAIRNICLNKKAKDFDICVLEDIEKVCEELEKNSFKVVKTGIRHGTISVFKKNYGIEITEHRGKPYDIKDDLSLRDFTINAIAFDVKKKKIVDPFNGFNDLKNNILKTPINPDVVFKNDPLRILRAFRFSFAQNRILEEKTKESLIKNFNKIKKVSIERIKDELSNILLSKNPALAIKKLQDFNFLKTLFPELYPMVGCTQNKYHKNDVFFHTLDVLKRSPAILEVRLAALLHDTGKPHTVSIDEKGERHFFGHEKESTIIARKFLERLCFSKKVQDTVVNIVSLHMRSLDAKASGIRRLIKDLGNDFEYWIRLVKADKPPMMSQKDFKKRLNNFLANYNEILEEKYKKDFFKPKITGDDIMKILNISSGKMVGKIKKDIESLILENPENNTKEFLIDYVIKKYSN